MSEYTLNVWNERDMIQILVQNNATGKTLWHANNFDENGTEVYENFWPIEDGFMKHVRDDTGLTDYLRSIGIFADDDYITKII